MLVNIYKVEDLFSHSFRNVLEIYKFKNIIKYVAYKNYLFLCVFSNDEEGTNLTISSDLVIFFNGDYNKLNKRKLRKILDDRIIRG